MALNRFHPAVEAWFTETLGEPTDAQHQAWPAIAEGRHTLIAAPTGSGKTLAAFLAAIDDLVRRGEVGELRDQAQVLYVSPLKALSNDVQKNLQQPLEGIAERLAQSGAQAPDLRAWVRTGDTPQRERERMRRQPPHIIVTTPESLYLMLTSDSGRRMLRTIRTVIVDEIHALAQSKRGAHLALSLERLAALTECPPVRIGLSATQKPVETMASFLVGAREDGCAIVDVGHRRDRDLALEVPGSPLTAVMANEVWDEVYDRLAELISAHGTTLIFANTRRLAERATRHLAERLGEEAVTAHHGSLSKEHRLAAEQRLKRGELRALVATASLELGIDIGDVGLVCQLGSPRSIAALLQRVGRSGHSVGGVAKGRLFPLSRDDLVECTALLDAARRGELDAIEIPEGALDVLAQQIVAEVGAGEWSEQALLEVFRRAWPYRGLSEEAHAQVVRMLADGFSTRRGRRGAYLHRDAVNGVLRPRRGARLVALTNGGTIPDQFDYDVILNPEGYRVGTLNEDFAFESTPGDIFQLGNLSYRILRVENGRVHVEDAHGAPPTLPFWFGEAPARTGELSSAVSDLRAAMDEALEQGLEAAAEWAGHRYGLPAAAARQLADYLGTARAALGALPTQRHVVFERFFDETGDMHFVVHAPFGSRINRAWGLALRKRFCRKFNFELQAAALEDSIVLSLGSTHSFPIEEPARYLSPETVRRVLTQALLDAPMFGTRWRWNATIALAVRRNINGRKAPPQFQRNDAEDLVAVVFPDQLACIENVAGEREIPDHPLVSQTLRDCLEQTMDAAGLEQVLRRLAAGEILVTGRDLTAPSPLAHEVVNARPYAFLDDAPQEERRTLAVIGRDAWSPADAAEGARLDADAIARVREEAFPAPRDREELHDALVISGFLTRDEAGAWGGEFEDLCLQGRACALDTGAAVLWVAAERLPDLRALLPDVAARPAIDPPADVSPPADEAEALRELVRSRLETLGPVTPEALAAPFGMAGDDLAPALLALETEGFAMRGRFTGTAEEQWCERRLLARIHRYTLRRLRAEIQPVSQAVFMRFLFEWHGLAGEPAEGTEALSAAVGQLEGFAAPAVSWEEGILPARVGDYRPYMLDQLCASGEVTWLRRWGGRLPEADPDTPKRRGPPVRQTPIALIERGAAVHWRSLSAPPQPDELPLSGPAAAVAGAMAEGGALFFVDLVQRTGLLRTQVEEALAELVSWGLATSDTFQGLRGLVTPPSRRAPFSRRGRRRGRARGPGPDQGGRWSLTAPDRAPEQDRDALVDHVVDVLLCRYGVIFRRLLDREAGLPPWRELLYVLRRLEARGEIRGGRFVDGFSGEQFALPEAVGALRRLRRDGAPGEYVAVSAADPLNLTGVVTAGERVPAQPRNRVLYRNGVPTAWAAGTDVSFLGALDADEQWQAAETLLRPRMPHPPKPM